MASTFCTTQEGPANALALNKDYTQVVIAGRNVFKVFNIKDDEFTEHCNLRVGKNLNLNFSCNDVAWNTIDDTVLATAATNGAVVVWNLNKQGRSKQDHVFNDHSRTVNKVNFHPIDAPLLISGSQDGTMKCFDLRTKEVIKTFFSNTESVRDVQFSPHHTHTFAAVSENGNVQLWDIRKPERCVQAYTAHSGPIFACDWHPEIPWLATASRDKTIKVWDLSGNKPTLEHTIHTIASVGHVKWRPQRKYHLASCALVVDCSINVWDVRRPYIPFASFDEHKDVATGVAWKGDPHCFLSTSRDNTLYRHMFSDASRPASRANIQGVSSNNRGDFTYACKTSSTPTVNIKISGLMRKTSINSDNFHQASSSLHRFVNKETSQTSAFYSCATKYILQGKSLTEMCEHNANVAKEVKKHHVYVVWNVIKTLYGNDINNLVNNKSGREESNSVNNNNIPRTGSLSGNVISNDQLSQNFESISINGDRAPTDTPSNGGGACSDDTENEDAESNHYLTGLTNLTSYQPGALAPRGDFIFGENELDNEFDRISSGIGLSVIPVQTIEQQQDWTLPIEAFPLRHELHDRSPPPEQYPNHHQLNNHQSNHISPDMNDLNNTPTVAVEDQPSSLLSVISIPKFEPWNPSNFVADTLKYHAYISDVQTAVSVLMVLGDYRPNYSLLEEAIQEQWIHGYLDQLARYRLWNVSSEVIKLSWIPSVNQLNQQSTTIHTFCGKCSKPLQRSGWLCDRCHTTDAALCSVCHQIVKGLYMWCQGCSHGGHLPHIKQWMASNKVCPTGCGHACEYS